MHNVVLNSAVALSAQAEERMIGDVDRRGMVRLSSIVYPEFVLRRHRIGHVNAFVARKSFLAVSMQVMQGYGRVRNVTHIPDDIVQSLVAAMQSIDSVVIGRNIVRGVIDYERRVADSVGDRSNAGTEKTLSRRGDIIF